MRFLAVQISGHGGGFLRDYFKISIGQICSKFDSTKN